MHIPSFLSEKSDGQEEFIKRAYLGMYLLVFLHWKPVTARGWAIKTKE